MIASLDFMYMTFDGPLIFVKFVAHVSEQDIVRCWPAVISHCPDVSN